jgi:3-hydroxybutyryl-CoA dehydrogenase
MIPAIRGWHKSGISRLGSVSGATRAGGTGDERAGVIDTVAVLGPGRIGRQIALAFALGGCRVLLVDLKPRPAGEADSVFTDARREIARDLGLMAEEKVVEPAAAEAALARLEPSRASGWPGSRRAASCTRRCRSGSTSSALDWRSSAPRSAPTRSWPAGARRSHLADALARPERFLGAHWLNPAHIIPLVEVVPGPATAPAVVDRTLAFLEALGKVPVRCADSPGFIGPRLQVLLMNEAARLVEEGVATPEDVDRAFRAGMGCRYAAVGLFEFIDCSVAISRSRPPQLGHARTSIANARCMRAARLQPREPLFAFVPSDVLCEPGASGGVEAVGSGATRPYATTRSRQRARAANRPWQISRFVSGRGVIAARRSNNSSGSNTSSRVPSCQGVFSSSAMRPSLRSRRRSCANGGRRI